MAHRLKVAKDPTTKEESTQAVIGLADGEEIRQEIQLRAYYRYCDRGCAPGADMSDWLAAEQEVLAERGKERC